MTVAAPSGVVTFLFTDVEGSTRRWENDAEAMRKALAVHDEGRCVGGQSPVVGVGQL
jgi:class 3 adenylate cyclase